MPFEKLTYTELPESLKGISENPIPPEEREAISTSVECGTVEDIRITLEEPYFEALKKQIQDLDSPSIAAKIADGQQKLPADKIELIGGTKPFMRVTTNEGEELRIPYTEETKSSGFGGGAFNTTTDAALIGQTIHENLGLDAEKMPETKLFLTLQEHEHRHMRSLCAQLKTLELNLIKGTPRRSVFIKKNGSDEEIYFSTPLGTIDSLESVLPAGPPRHLVLHNQPDAKALNSIKEAVKQSAGNTHLTWSLGSNQIREGIDRHQNLLALCNAFTCNLPEAITWLRSSRDPLISQDPTLLAALEETTDIPKNPEHRDHLTSVILKLTLKAKLAIHAFLKKDGKTLKFKKIIEYLKNDLPKGTLNEAEIEELTKAAQNYKLSDDPTKREAAGERAAQLLSSMMNESSYVFLTDSASPTTIVRTKKDATTGEVIRTQHYVPILNESKKQAINQAIAARGALPENKDGTGCGDCYTATVVALRQAAGKNIQATTIAVLANHYTYLVYCLGYSNLLEIEKAYPGIVKAVTQIALEDLDQQSTLHHQHNAVPLLPNQKITSAVDRILHP